MEQNISRLKSSFDKIAKKYNKSTNTFHHEISEYVTIKNLFRELPEKKDIKILDSGGGIGKFTFLLKKHGYDVILCDISPESIKQAQSKAFKENVELTTHVCDSENTPFPDNSFDVVMMVGGVISYTPHPEKLLQEAYRILKPNGMLWFDFVNALGWAIESTDPWFKAGLALEQDRLIQMRDWDYPLRLFSPDRMKKMISECGFYLKTEYGLILLSNSLPLHKRYAKKFDRNLLETYCNIELELSRRSDCVGASWSCSMSVIKE